MNTEAHQHVAHIEREDEVMKSGMWVVRYGDTKTYFAWPWQKPWKWSEERQQRVIGAAIARAIKSHDRGSQKAAKKYEPKFWRSDRENAIVKSMFPTHMPRDVWATSAMKEVASGN